MQTSNKDIAHLLRSVAAAYELKGFNRFRRIAYEQAADAIEHLNREIYDVWQNGELEAVSGVGATLSNHLDEYFAKKGSEQTYLIRQIKEFPPSVFELMKVPGLGAKRAYKLSQQFNISAAETSLSDLLKFAEAGKIAPLDGFGEKSQTAIITSIKTFLQEQHSEVRMPLAYATELAEEIIAYMKQNPHIEQIDSLGSLRRQVATIGDIDLAAVTDKKYFTEIISHFIAYPGRVKTETQGENKASMTVAGGRDVDLRLSEPESYGAMLQYFTGSKLHNIRLREYALKKGYSLNEFGIKSLEQSHSGKRSASRIPERSWASQDDGRYIFKTEEEFYNFLGLPWIPPEIREGTNEVELAIKNKLPGLVTLPQIRGDLQIHSDYDLTSSHDVGEDSIDTIIKQARLLKYDYIAITDHNPAQSVGSEDKIVDIMKARQQYFANYQEKFNIIISCEVDITPDGGIALPRRALEYVDMILVSIHSSFRQDRQTMTGRILNALSNPKVKVLAHPTGRLLGKRQEIEADWTAIFKECKKRGIAVEINSYPERLDLPDSLVRQAKDMGLKFTLGTDAHGALQMENMRYGVSVARRGWLEKSDIINTRTWKEVRKWIEN